MSFLDNLENNLKALESHEDAAGARKEEQKRREDEQARAAAAAPYADLLRSGPYVQNLLNAAITVGHTMRTKIHMAWLGTTLRLEARDRKLELRPDSNGIIAAFLENNVEIRREQIDLAGDPEELARQWLQPAL